MWDGLSHYCKLRKLQDAKKRTGDADNKLIEEAKKACADHNELDSLMHDAHIKELYFDDQILTLQFWHLTIKAERYLLPIPPFDMKSGDWEESGVTGRWRLALPAHAALRTAIYDYEKGRRERIQSWLVVLSGIIAASTCLIGALIGLIAISK